MKKRSMLQPLVLIAVFASFAQGLFGQAGSKPNILFILADDLGYGDLSSYGARDLQSPAIDSLVSAGMRFDRFYANCPVCSPTRAAALSGNYPDRVGVPGVIRTHAENSWGFFDLNAVTLPQVLNKAGYHTAIVGKWHLGLEPENHPVRRGFDFFHGFLGDMMDDYYKHTRHGNHYMRRNDQDIRPEGHATDLFTGWAIDYIAERSKTDQPFFLYLAYNAPHTPIQPPQDWLKKIRDREPGIEDKRSRLVALIEHMDDGIGRVVQALKQHDAYDRTLIIFTSDNGGQLNVGANNQDLRGGKQEMYEGGIRVPMCAVWPGRIQPGSQGDFVGITMDLYPTICEAAGADVSHAIDGASILSTLLGGKAQPFKRDLFWVRREGGNRYMGHAYYAVQRDGWKLMQNAPGLPFELYNLNDDPFEEVNLADKNKKKFSELGSALRGRIQRAGEVPWQKP